ncbi:MAG: O-antigen ligase family protein [Candidatus Thorarchaeota archaeon]
MKESIDKSNNSRFKEIRYIYYLIFLWLFSSLIHLLWYDSAYFYGYDLKRPLNYIEYFAILYIMTSNIRNIKILERILLVYCFSVMCLIFLTYLKSLGIPIYGYERLTTKLIGPFTYGVTAIQRGGLDYSSWTLPIINIIMISIVKKYPFNLPKIMLILILPVIIFGIFLNGSRSTILAINGSLIVSIYYLINYILQNKSIARRYLRRLYLGVAFLIVFFLLIYSKDIFEIFASMRKHTADQRLMGYSIGIELITKSWNYFLFGAGKDHFISMQSLFTKERLTTHNALLEEIVTDGIFGLAIMIILFVKIFRIAFKNIMLAKMYELNKLYVLSIVAIVSIISVLFEGVFGDIIASYSIWLMIGIIMSIYQIIRKYEIRNAQK